MQEKNILTISYLNIKGQTGFKLDKQFQVEDFLKQSKSDILHLQEVHIEDDTFEQCNFIATVCTAAVCIVTLTLCNAAVCIVTLFNAAVCIVT